MPEPFDRPTITRLLSELERRDRQRLAFGSAKHDYKLNAPVRVSTVDEFEARHGITLPGDYRRFITEIGNGGAGPYYGLFPFGELEDGLSWEESKLVGDVSQPFPHLEAWNLPVSFWEQFPDISPDTPLEEEERLLAAWDKAELEQYFNPAIVNGAIPICHLGCGLRQWLVVKGEQKGFVWNDFRADHRGLRPLQDESGRQMTFSDWYKAWLSDLPNQPISKYRRELTPWGLIVGGVLFGSAMLVWASLPILPRALVAVGLLLGLVAAVRNRPRDLLTLLVVTAAGVLLGLTPALFGLVMAWLRG